MANLPSTFRIADAIDEAFERNHFDPTGITAQHIRSAQRSIRLMLDEWNNDSVDFWKNTSGNTQALVVNQQTFQLDPSVIDILDMAVLRGTYTTPMDVCSRSDWFSIPDKETTVGMPTRYWVERIGTGFIVHIYPMAENVTDVLVYDAMTRFNDSSVLGSGADIPPLWNAAFTAGLTFYLAEKFNAAEMMAKKALYGGPGYNAPPHTPLGAYQIARMGNRERANTTFIVSKNRRPRR